MQLVLVEWVDAVYHDLWEALDDTDPTDMTVKSVGWLVKDTPEYKLVVPHQQCAQVRGGISIPSRAVVKIEKLAVEVPDGFGQGTRNLTTTRKSLKDADTSPGARGIPVPVRRFVWARDQAQCTFESSNGRRCPERLGLQFHHHDLHGLGGDRSANNVRLLCRPHNLYMAEMDYGKDKMEQYRRLASYSFATTVREPSPLFPLFPDRAQESPPLIIKEIQR